MRRMRSGRVLDKLFALLLLALPLTAIADKEYRTVNAGGYELVLLRSGRVDVLLPSGRAVFHRMEAFAKLEGKRLRALPLQSTASARVQLKTRLGQGHGFTVQGKNCAWNIDAYPTKPFLTVQLEYSNQGRKPVTLESLQPWAGELRLGLGDEGTQVLVQEKGLPRVASDSATSRHHLAMFDPATGTGLVAGFLEPAAAEVTLEVTRETDAEPGVFGPFTATVHFDPPITVEPGQKLLTPRLYLAVGEQDLLTGLDRFGKALAVVNGVHDARPFVPHGWVVPAGQDAASTGRWLQEHLAPFGYDTLWLPPGQNIAPVGTVRVGQTVYDGTVDPAANAVYLAEPGALATRPVPESVYLAATGSPVDLGRFCDGVCLQSPEGATDWQAEVTAWARLFYLTPHLLLPQWDAAPVTGEHLRARLTAIALLGGPVRVEGAPDSASPDTLALLRRLLPVTGRAARPLDLFEAHAPRVWSLPLDDVHLFGLFNLDGTEPVVVSAFFEAAGLLPATYYAIYDAWEQQYLGTAVDVLQVSVPPGEVRLLALRRLEDRPIFLANDAHFAQGAMDAEPAQWDAANRRFHGAFQAVADTPYTLTFLVPETLPVDRSEVSTGEPSLTREEKVVRLRVTPTETGLLRWGLHVGE